jgi:calcineurin-like phosphoesterase family protein
MNRWLTSDVHIGHAAVIDYCKRPFTSLEHMHEEIIKRWNSRVKPEDLIYVCGDFALCSYKEFVPLAKQLNGTIKLVLGNHDHYSQAQYNALGIEVCHELKLKIAGQMCRLSHYPYALPWYKRPFAFKSELRFMEKRPPKIPGEFLIHGHVHTKYKMAQNRIHVGQDAWNHYPVSFREIESLMNNYLKEKNGVHRQRTARVVGGEIKGSEGRSL